MRDIIKRVLEDDASSSSKAPISVSVSNKIRKVDLADETNHLPLGQASHPQDKDPQKLKRMMDNRIREYKLLKAQYVHELENHARDLEAMNDQLCSQLEECESEKHLLKLEKQVLAIQLIYEERERVAREGEIEKYISEVNKRNEILSRQVQMLGQRMQLAASSSNSVQAPNGWWRNDIQKN